MTELGEPASTVGMVPVGVGEAPVVAADTVVPAGCAGAAMPPACAFFSLILMPDPKPS